MSLGFQLRLSANKWVLFGATLIVILGVASFVQVTQVQYKPIDNPLTIQSGGELFQRNCASCHGQKAQGTVADWQVVGEDGKYPPPPLDGSAHAWHHSIEGLTNTIRNGTVELGGSMPAWKGTLSDDEIFSIIAWLASLWPEEIYTAWQQRNEQ